LKSEIQPGQISAENQSVNTVRVTPER